MSYKRAAVILASAEGKQGEVIASQYHVNQNSVIKWRGKFKNGGVEGLMSNAPIPAKNTSDDPSVVEQVKETLAGNSPDGDPWTVRKLAKHLQLPRLSICKIFDRLGITLPENTPSTPNIVLPDLQQKCVQIIGLFLTLSVQILAFV